MRRLAPTARLAAILAAIAVCALFVPVVLAAALAVALFGAALADAWTVRRPPGVERTVPPVLSLGAELPVSVVVHAGDRRRVLLRQPGTPALAVRDGRGAGGLSATVVAQRRGRQELPGVASASLGPLGLARVHHPAGPPLAVRVYPDLVAARALIARLRRRLAGHPGLAARGALGLGTDFESIRDYTADDDIRQINWRATARMGRPMSNQYRLERDRDVICLLDAGRLTAAPLGDVTVLDVVLGAVGVLAMAADELGDRCGAIVFDAGIRVHRSPRPRAGARIVDALLDLQARPVESDFEQAFSRVGASRRALVVVFTDLVDEAAARSLLAGVPLLARRHALLVASPHDPALQALAERPAPGADGHGGAPGPPRAVAEAVVARDVLAARHGTTVRLRRAGADVLDAPPDRLAARCLDAYLDMKARVRV